MGYFTALYRKVTVKVKEGIESGFFDDGDRMEKLDIIFANQYIDAYYAFREKKPCTASWEKSFDYAQNKWLIVLQHLLLAMNAHINMDLGIAAAEVSKGTDIAPLQDDFNKINAVLSDLVIEVQKDLAEVWPPLKWILKFTGNLDNRITDFSMELARDGAWEFASALANTPQEEWKHAKGERDRKISGKTRLVTQSGPLIQLMFAIIRLGERGSVADRVQKMED